MLQLVQLLLHVLQPVLLLLHVLQPVLLLLHVLQLADQLVLLLLVLVTN